MNKTKNQTILIFGATGFIGSHLLDRLIKKRHEVIALARTPSKIKKKSKYLTVVKGDLLEPKTYEQALNKADTIYYLVHAMDKDGSFEDIETKQAQNVASKLRKNQRLIYLSGLGSPESEHIRSRQKVGEIFRNSKAKATELRASIVLGAGSLSFEMIYGIARRFPFSVKTDWSEAACEPVALEDILLTLEKLADNLIDQEICEIGSGEVVPYSDLIIKTAKLLDKNMLKVPIPRVPKSLVLEVMRFMLPEYYQTGQHLMGSIEIPTYVENQNVLDSLGKKPVSINHALQKAIANSDTSNDFTWQDKIAEIVSTLPDKHKRKIRLFLKGVQFLRR